MKRCLNVSSIYREQKRAEVWLAPMREGEFVREGIDKERGAKREFMSPVGLSEFSMEQ